MTRAGDSKDRITLKEVVGLFGLPTLPELVIDGLNLDATLYRKLVVRLAQHYFSLAHLALVPVDEDTFQVEPAPGSDWEDAAYWLGNLINHQADRVVVAAPGELLGYGTGGGEPHPTLRAAVLANLGALSSAPRFFRLGSPAEALRKAAESALEVAKVRELAH